MDEFSSIRVFLLFFNEQQEIAPYLGTQCGQIDKIVSKLYNEIPRSAEYRTRLTSDVIMGKLDVRGVVVAEFEAVEDIVESKDELGDNEISEETPPMI